MTTSRWLLAAAALLPAAIPLRAQTAAPAVATAPVLGAPPKLTLPSVQRASLPNGLTVQVVEMHAVPVVRATLLIPGGARLDGARPGLATFTASMLTEGAGTRDAFALAAETEFLGASLRSSASWDATIIALSAPKRTFAQGMELLADVLLRPTFRVADITRQRDLRLASILQQRDQPAAVAGAVFTKLVFPAGHPYHGSIGGDSASTAGLDSATVRNYWTRAASPRGATLIVTGDITLAEAKALASTALGGWTVPARPFTVTPPAALATPPRPATRIILVDKPGAAQSVINIGAPGVPRSSPDYAAIQLMNTILGGSFSSRLNDILREEKGYTYGARSSYSWRPVPGPFLASAAVRTNVTDSSLAIFFRELERIRDTPVSASELDRARNYLVLGSLGDFETTGDVASELASLNTFGLPLATIPRELDAVKKLTVSDVQQAARRYIDPAHLTVVIVGDIAKIRPGIEALKIGPVSVRDFEGKEVVAR
jgi:zinc protease